MRCRYVIAESEFADHQISRMASVTWSADGIPWAASLLMLTHVAAGKPTVGGAGRAP